MHPLRRFITCGLLLLGVVTACSDTACDGSAQANMSVAVLAADTGRRACNTLVFAEVPDTVGVLAVCPAPDCCGGQYKVDDDCCHGEYILFADAGTHTITAKAPGYKSQSQTVGIGEGGRCGRTDSTVKLTFVLEPE
jgi:hypothetical protein